ncbi:VanW family protein [Thalassobacillus sp. CUG 92003]|uniref:VanW family protein n=1 Tax=Thalassobacillus sp. CUG 92003 TaxID=2736641 RepID=UPI0015E7BBAF|nr:VanW family protein [Thalassobacillus sp. CUG 92003]
MKFITLSIYLLAFQLFIQDDDLTIVDDGEEILDVNREQFEAEFLGQPFVNETETQKLIDELNQEISQKPLNAKIGESGEIIPGEDGSKVYKKAFLEKFYHYLHGTGSSTLQVPKIAISPKVDVEMLANIRTKQIGHYVTYFNSSNKERTHNIHLASEAIDSHVVFPGDIFSFNKVVGKRTKDKGYKEAPVIVKGEVTEGIGGGICQVSSTLYNSVANAGLDVKERYSHSKSVPYVPSGRDATVSWYGPDFTFENQYNQPVLIRSNVYGGQMSITIYSSDVINFDPQNIPEASDKLPEEKDTSAQGINQ